MINKSILYIDEYETAYTRGIKNALKKIYLNVYCYFHKDILATPWIYTKLHSQKNKLIQYEKIDVFIDFLSSKKFDKILINNVGNVPSILIERIRESHKNVPIISYNWSSISKYNFLPQIPYFNKVYSFDPSDCRKYKLNYLPLFYLNEIENVRNQFEKQFDLSFLGSALSPGREKFFNNLFKSDKLNNLRTYFYLFASSRLHILKAKLKYTYLSKYLYKYYLSYNEVLNVYAKSYAFIDHPMSIQTGLTIRTFETLGAGLDLYTTNKGILNEPFYNPDRIYLFKEDLSDFEYHHKKLFDSEWQSEFKKYNVNNWITKVLKV